MLALDWGGSEFAVAAAFAGRAHCGMEGIAPSMPGWTTCHGSDSALPSIRSAMPAIAGRVLRLPRQPKRSPCNPPDRSAPAQFAGKRGFIQKARVGEVRIRARIWASGNGFGCWPAHPPASAIPFLLPGGRLGKPSLPGRLHVTRLFRHPLRVEPAVSKLLSHK